MKKDILFVMAHFDDESFQIGTILKLLEEGHKIQILTVCGNDFDRSMLSNHIVNQESFQKIFWTGLMYEPLSLKQNSKTKKDIEKHIKKILIDNNINAIYYHYDKDLHYEHKIIANIINVLIRPDRDTFPELKEAYQVYTPGSSEQGKNFNINEFNKVVDISDFIEAERNALEVYSDYLKGVTSPDKVIDVKKYFGNLYNLKYASVYKTIFNIS